MQIWFLIMTTTIMSAIERLQIADRTALTVVQIQTMFQQIIDPPHLATSLLMNLIVINVLKSLPSISIDLKIISTNHGQVLTHGIAMEAQITSRAAVAATIIDPQITPTLDLPLTALWAQLIATELKKVRLPHISRHIDLLQALAEVILIRMNTVTAPNLFLHFKNLISIGHQSHLMNILQFFQLDLSQVKLAIIALQFRFHFHQSLILIDLTLIGLILIGLIHRTKQV